MRRLYSYLIVTFYIVTIFPQFSSAQLSETMLADRNSAVVLVRAVLPGGVRETGSGMIIGYDNSSIYIITAAHVVEQNNVRATKVYVEFYNKPTLILEAKILKTDADRDRDLALLNTDIADLIISIRPLPIADFSKPLIETSAVYTIGHPGKRIWSVNKGTVVNDPDPTKIGFSVDASEPGNSGGPLLNAEGELIGMVLEGSSYVGSALRADLAKDLVAKVWNSPTNNIRTKDFYHKISSIELEPREDSIMVGEQIRLTVTLKDARGIVIDAPDMIQNIIWWSNNLNIADIVGNGVIRGNNVGSAFIYVKIEGKTDSARINVESPIPESIAIDPSRSEMKVGETITLRAILRNARGSIINYFHPITWSSSDPSIITVSSIGQLKAHAYGTVTVSATCEGKAGSAIIEVIAATPARIEIVPKSVEMNIGGSVHLSAVVTDADGKTINNPKINWSSGDATIASVSSDGIVTAHSPGMAEVTAYCGNVYRYRQVIVNGGQIYVSVEPNSKSVKSNEWIEVTVRASSEQGRPIQNANVECAHGFSPDKGLTDSNGVFRTRWKCYPCAPGYSLGIRVWKYYYREGEARIDVTIY